MINKKEARAIIQLLEDATIDMDIYSVHNDDEFGEEIEDIYEAIESMKQKI